MTVSQKCERAKYLLLMLVLNFAQCNKFWSGKYAHQHIDHDLMFSQKQQQQKTTAGKKYAEPKLKEYERASVSTCDASRAGINHWRHIFVSLTIQFVNYYSEIQRKFNQSHKQTRYALIFFWAFHAFLYNRNICVYECGTNVQTLGNRLKKIHKTLS